MACPDGQYFCNDRQKCMPIPKGHKVRNDGELVKEATREDAEKKRLAKDNPDDYAVRNIGHGKWSTKRKSSMKGQAKRRGEGLKDVDSDLPSKSKERGETKTKKIVGRGKEHHHLTPISQSTKEFKGLSPEQRKAKREKDAKQHKYHGSDPRNLAQAEGPKGGKGIPHRGEGGYHSKQKAVGSGGEGKDFGSEAQILAVKRRKASRERRQNEEFVYEVAPPGWGHTKAEKEKTDPSKPKSKIGGSAAAFDRARKEGRFKGSKADMFKLMWWMKNKGGKPKGKPHYKPGTDEKYKKYQEEYKDPVHYALETDKKIMKLLDKDNKKKKKKYEESTSMKNVDPKDRKVIKARQKNLFKRDLTGEHQGINELNTKEYKKLNKASVGMMSSDPKVQDKARERQTEIDYKDLLSQIKKKKVKVGKSMKEGKCDDCTCPGCGPNGVGHQNPCVKCGGHHKEKVNEKYGDTFDTSKQKKKDASKEKENTSRDLRMKYGKKWKEFTKDAASAKNKLKPGEVKKLVNGKWVSNKG